MTANDTAALAESLARVRYEVIPTGGVHDQLPYLPAGATVTITSSPTKGIAATLDLAERLAGQGFTVVPHVAARLVTGRAELAGVLRRMEGMGVRDVFVVAGDAADPAGPFEGASALLREMADLGHGLEHVGVTGYPESHALISDQTTISAMFEKAPYATYIVSQICFDAATTARWIGAVRRRGVELPIHLGLPGAVDRTRLLRISMKVGLGDSLRFLRKQSGVVARLFSGYTPDELVEGLSRLLVDERAGVFGWHLFTFNEIERTERWRRQYLARLQGATA